MKTTKLIQVFTAVFMATALLGGCSQDDDPTDGGNPVAVSFTAGIEAGTRTTTGGSEWVQNGDKVGIFMLATGGSLSTSADLLADNEQYNVTNGETGALSPNSGTPIYYPRLGNVDFIAYYPYGTTGNLYNISVAGQTSEAAQNALDVLYAKTIDVAKTKSAVALSFNHVLSKVTLDVKLGAKLASLTGSHVTAVSFFGMPQTATLTLQDGSLAAGTAGSFEALKAGTASGNADATFSALLVPQAAGGSGRTAVFTVNGATYTWNISDTETFAPGNHYTYTVTIDEAGITVSYLWITKWNGNDHAPDMAQLIPMTVKIPAGTFLMGSSDGSNPGDTNGSGLNTTSAEPNRVAEETQHRVTLAGNFWMSKYLITNAQYAAFLNEAGIDQSGMYRAGSNPAEVLVYQSSTQSGGSYDWGVNWYGTGIKWAPAVGYEHHPAIFVTWYGAYEYAKWVGGDLPTEAQWEYACRGGEANKPFGVGDGYTLDYELAYFYWPQPWSWNGIDANADTSGSGSYPNTTQNVGSYAPNAWGLYDMHGNVYEWCSDWYDNNAYGSTDVTDPTGPTTGSSRVARGGGWTSSGQYCRSAARASMTPYSRYNYLGFRVVFAP